MCNRASEKIEKKGLWDRIEIVCEDGAKYPFEEGAFDVATCIGASFIWKSYEPTLKNMKKAVREKGKMAIGEPYWQKKDVPQEYLERNKGILTEHELLQITHKEGFEFQYIVRANSDDWDRYETGNWDGFIRWLEDNPDHPERQDVIDRLHEVQRDYLQYGREYIGWAIYVLSPLDY